MNVITHYFSFRVHAPMIAVGSDDTNPSAGGKVQIYEYSDNTRYAVATIKNVAQKYI